MIGNIITILHGPYTAYHRELLRRMIVDSVHEKLVFMNACWGLTTFV